MTPFLHHLVNLTACERTCVKEMSDMIFTIFIWSLWGGPGYLRPPPHRDLHRVHLPHSPLLSLLRSQGCPGQTPNPCYCHKLLIWSQNGQGWKHPMFEFLLVYWKSEKWRTHSMATKRNRQSIPGLNLVHDSFSRYFRNTKGPSSSALVDFSRAEPGDLEFSSLSPVLIIMRRLTWGLRPTMFLLKR